MTVSMDINEYSIFNELWSGARTTLDELTVNDVRTILNILDNGESMDLTELNDFFWFERDTIAEWLGYNNFDVLMNDRKQGVTNGMTTFYIGSTQLENMSGFWRL